MRTWLIVGMFFLGGCNIISSDKLWMAPLTPEELAAIDKQAAEAQAKAQAKTDEESAQKIISQYRPMCTQLGLKEGTPDFANCVLRLYENAETVASQGRASRRAAAAAILNNGPTTTNCNKYGNSVNCTSY